MPEARTSKMNDMNTASIVTLPPDYKPSSQEEYMSAFQLEYFRRKLETWKMEILRESAETIHHMQEESHNESDLADRATTETDRSLELRARDRERKLLNKINDALDRIRDGSYGYCEETGDPIGLARLEARPIATLSLEAQERHEKEEKIYREE